jgi:hypothetical protein
MGGKEKSEINKVSSFTIYEIEGSSANDIALIKTCQEAMFNANFPIHLDIRQNGTNNKAIIKTNSIEEKDQKTEAALFLGLIEASRRNKKEPKELLNNLISQPELFEEFRNYYSGLRWSSDQERFVSIIFEYGTDFDSNYLDENLKGENLLSLVNYLNLDIPYEKRSNWYEISKEKIFMSFPEFDYRRLKDQEFCISPEGQKLYQAYSKLMGTILANQYRRYDKDRNIQIPLSRHPIIEALVIDELSFDRPKPKYNFGPSDLIDFVLNSDSEPAHSSLIKTIITRLPEEYRQVFDGPNEFQHKHRNVCSVLNRYRELYEDK